MRTSKNSVTQRGGVSEVIYESEGDDVKEVEKEEDECERVECEV